MTHAIKPLSLFLFAFMTLAVFGACGSFDALSLPTRSALSSASPSSPTVAQTSKFTPAASSTSSPATATAADALPPTQTAAPSLSATPLKTSTIAFTPTRTKLPDYRCELYDQTPRNGSSLLPNADFDGRWIVKNTGAKTWQAGEVVFRYISGYEFQKRYGELAIGVVKPNKTAKIIVDMLMPLEPGVYKALWGITLEKDDSIICMEELILYIQPIKSHTPSMDGKY
ncbi:MAG: hypothetical protein HPY45_16850 [Anaerolineae bacterium]|nr:hypothetical protein [Anaerolineae bacterium]